MNLFLKKISKVLMSFLMIFGLFTVSVRADTTALLTNLEATVTQGGLDITAENPINSSENVDVELSFGVPTIGDGGEPGTYFEKGDEISFKISDSFTLVSDIIEQEFKSNGILIGHVDITTDTSGALNATITFDGDVFTYDYGNITAELNLNLAYSGTDEDATIGNHEVFILDKSYTVNVADDTNFTIGKNGKVVNETDGTYIDWTVTIDATNKDSYDISGYTFSDDLSSAGTYVTDSFKVGATSYTANIEGNTISYTFMDGTIEPTVTYRTKISDDIANSNSKTKYANTAELTNANKDKWTGDTTVTINDVNFDVVKSGEIVEETVGEDTKGYIKWTVTVDGTKDKQVFDIKGFEFEDNLIDSGTYKDGSFEVGGAIKTVTQDGTSLTYLFPEGSTGKQTITYLTVIPDEIYNSTTTKTYKNTAYVNGDEDQPDDTTWPSNEVEVVVNDIEFTVVKSGSLSNTNDGALINWTLVINGSKDGVPFDIEGFEFTDDLSSAGNYVADSFEVGTTSYTPNIDGNTISYIFPNGSTGTQVITYQTKYLDSSSTSASDITTLSNTAEILDGYGEGVTGGSSGVIGVGLNKTWISKSASSVVQNYENDTATITWTVEANQEQVNLIDAKITDIIPDAVTFVSAQKYIYNKTTNNYEVYEAAITTKPTDGIYNYGTINSKVKLEITVIYNDINDGKRTVINNAKLTGNNGTEVISKETSADKEIGQNPITKVSKGYNVANHSAKWEVSLIQSGYYKNARVLDLLVYGTSFDPSTTTYSIEDNSAGDLTDVTNDVLKDLTPQYNQSYISGTFTPSDSSNMTIKVHTIKDSTGKAIADLLVVTESGSGIQLTSTGKSFTYESRITNPDIYVKNGSTSIKNTASLNDGDTSVSKNNASFNFPSEVLSKTMLDVNAAKVNDGAINDVTGDASTSSNGFNYNDKTVVFKLEINKNQLDTTNSYTNLSEIILKDTLPEGWEFVDILTNDDLTEAKNGSGFLVYDNTDSLIDAPSFVSASLNDAKNEMTFSFTELTNTYTILVRATPTEETLKTYFQDNTDVTITNNATLETAETNNIVENDQQVEIKNDDVLSKNSPSSSDGALTWTIEYKPYNNSFFGNKIIDTLPEGIEIRTDSEGNLDFSNVNFVIKELNLADNGTYTEGIDITINNDIIKYNVDSRELTFVLPDANQGYIINYITDITGNDGLTINNTVNLPNYSVSIINSSATYQISSYDASATMSRLAWLKITKTDLYGSKLSGATFGLFTDGKEVAIRQGTTATDGTLYLRAIPEGSYTLKETLAPEDYEKSNLTYSVEIKSVDGVLTTFIDSEINKELTITNKQIGTVGDLTIEKTASGNATETGKDFKFTITMESLSGTYYYTGKNGKDNGSVTFEDNKANFTLKINQSITLLNIPKDTEYTVTEEDYKDNGYTTTYENNQAKILVDDNQTVVVNNERNTGSLEISKELSGNGTDATKGFEFEVNISGLNGEYPFTGTANGVTDGSLKFVDGIASLTLKGGESIVITNIVIYEDSFRNYEIKEADYSAEGYITTVNNVVTKKASGTLPTEKMISETTANASATFTNSRNVGSLNISKVLAGNATDATKGFEFELNITGLNGDYSYTGTANDVKDGTLKFVNGLASLTLKGGESITIGDIVNGTEYKVTETDYSEAGYVTTTQGVSGNIETNKVKDAVVTNTRNTGSLKISKELSGNGTDATKGFEFEVNISGLNGEYPFTGTANGVTDGSLKFVDGIASLTLKGGESIAITNIVIYEDSFRNYEIKEADYSAEGYITTVNNVVTNKASGTLPTEKMISETTANASATFTNSRNVGSLNISKVLAGNATDATKGFEFEVNITGLNRDYSYTGTANGVKDGTLSFVNGLASLTLKGGESITIVDLVNGTAYKVTEKDYSTAGYVTTTSAINDTIKTAVVKKAVITNTRNTGSLVISKELEGNGTDPDKDFNFEIIFEGVDGSYPYTGTNGKEDGVLVFVDGKAEFTLKGGQTITIKDVLSAIRYKVTQKDYTDEGYATTVNGVEGAITTGESNALVVNERNIGNLTVSKVLSGNGTDSNKEFSFTVEVDGVDDSYAYTGTNGKADGTLTFVDGKAEFTLKGGQSITILGILEDSNYSVYEADYTSEGYTTTITDSSGTIDSTITASVVATNERNVSVASDNNPKTGDHSLATTLTYLFISIIAMLGLIVTLIFKRKLRY